MVFFQSYEQLKNGYLYFEKFFRKCFKISVTHKSLHGDNSLMGTILSKSDASFPYISLFMHLIVFESLDLNLSLHTYRSTVLQNLSCFTVYYISQFWDWKLSWSAVFRARRISHFTTLCFYVPLTVNGYQFYKNGIIFKASNSSLIG